MANKNKSGSLKLKEELSKLPRVLTFAQIAKVAKSYEFSNIDEIGLIQETDDLFLNANCSPKGRVEDLTTYICPKSSLSLHFILGRIGFLNSPSSIYTCISAGKSPRELKTKQGHVFKFYELPEGLNPSNFKDHFDTESRYPCVIPERALCDWIYLSSRGIISAPPVDVDIEQIDMNRAAHIANEIKVSDHLKEYIDYAESMGFGEEGFFPKEKIKKFKFS